MKRLILSAALLAGSGRRLQRQESQPPEQSNKAAMPSNAPAATQASATQKPINKYCAVDRDEEVDPTVTYLYQGKVIGFCCDDCIPEVQEGPGKVHEGSEVIQGEKWIDQNQARLVRAFSVMQPCVASRIIRLHA